MLLVTGTSNLTTHCRKCLTSAASTENVFLKVAAVLTFPRGLKSERETSIAQKKELNKIGKIEEAEMAENETEKNGM